MLVATQWFVMSRRESIFGCSGEKIWGRTIIVKQLSKTYRKQPEALYIKHGTT